jgi:hypothetical protein
LSRLPCIERRCGSLSKFGPEEWLCEEAVGKGMWDLLPSGGRELNKERIVEVEALIADNGDFPAIKIGKRFAE